MENSREKLKGTFVCDSGLGESEDIDLLLSSYNYELPPELIADRPASKRDESRLLVYKMSDQSITHTTFKDLPQYLPKESLLLLNQTKVFACRLFGKKESGGKAELFFLSLEARSDGSYPCLIKCSGKKRKGDLFLVGNEEEAIEVRLLEATKEGDFWVTLSLPLEEVLEKFGKIPIPPYIRKGESDSKDHEDYQTVFAKNSGSVAAPTAGLHFTDEVFKKLDDRSIERSFVTLHVGRGTFAPVKEEHLKNHKMHTETYYFDEKNREKIVKAQEMGKKIFCVGTTSLRALESAIDEKGSLAVEPERLYSTDIFLHPGVRVQSIEGLITNFHLPESTLLMLVSSLIGREKTLELYREAVRLGYRFFSYGDAMLILRN